MPTLPQCPVSEVPAADPQIAADHFARLLEFETDCWDVHLSIESRKAQFVLLDVRSPESFAEGHVPTAVSLPHRRIVERNIASYAPDTLFVVYCNGPHCNGADRAALRLARLGRKVKKMIGGIEGWKDEGFSLVRERSEPEGRGVLQAQATSSL
jgi:rhodanese-related sulfurtransferase